VTPHDASTPEPTSPRPAARREPPPVAGRIEPAAPSLPPLPPESDLPAALSSAPDAGALLRALRRRWVAAVCLGGTLAAIAAVSAWFLMSPKYTAFARVKVAYQRSVTFHDQAGGAGDFRTYLKTQAQQILSRTVLWEALKSEPVKRLNLESQVSDPMAYIEEELKVEQHEDSEVMTIYLSSFDPVVSTTLLKAIIDAYLSQVVYAEDRTRRARFAEVEKSHTEAVQSLTTKKKSLEKMAKDLGTDDPMVLLHRLMETQGALTFAQQERSRVASQIIGMEAELDSLDARIKAAKDPASAAPVIKPLVDADPEVKELRGRIKAMEAFLKSYTDKGLSLEAPSPAATSRRLAAARADLDKRMKEVEEEVRARPTGSGGPSTREQLELMRVQMVNRIEALKKLQAGLEKDVKELTVQKAQLMHTNTEYDAARSQVQRFEKVVDDLGVQLEKERFELNGPARISVIQEAELQKKEMKKQILVTVAAPLAVLFLVCMGLAWTEHRQRRVRTAGEVARGLGIRVVGAVPDVPHLERRLVGPEGETELEGQPVLESIDALRTLLLHDAEAPRVVLVTSATSGEGKTTLAAHLAGSLARAGRKTLLLDGDLRNPTAHQLFELPPQPGFSEALLGEVDMADAVKTTSLEGLSFLAAGQWDREVMQALARNGLEGVFDKLREEFDFLVIDSHPVLSATDALLLGRQVDAVILSVLREVSQMPRVYTAAQRLQALGIRVLGAVVNGADPEEALPAQGRAAVA
jgi:capsular exopolysaccharide synthesis family protein